MFPEEDREPSSLLAVDSIGAHMEVINVDEVEFLRMQRFVEKPKEGRRMVFRNIVGIRREKVDRCCIE